MITAHETQCTVRVRSAATKWTAAYRCRHKACRHNISLYFVVKGVAGKLYNRVGGAYTDSWDE